MALGVVGTLVGFFLMLFLLFFLLRDGRMMLTHGLRLVPDDGCATRASSLTYLSAVMSAVIFGHALTAVIQGTLVGIGFAIAGLPSPLVFAVFAAIAAFVPAAGTGLVLVPAVIYLAIAGRWGAATFLGIWSVLVGFSDNFLRPYLTRQRADVSTLTVFVGVIGGVSAFGFIGSLLGPGAARADRRAAALRGRFRHQKRLSALKCASPMDVSPLLAPLNDAQREAVTAPLGAVLVLAGAGSGKTRVLIHRIAWLIQVENVSPHGVLAVTFTNKAAGEMRGRIEQLLGMPGSSLWIGTFHGIAHRLLRRHWREAGLVQSFQILDSEDQQRLIRKMLKAQELDESIWVPREIQWFINHHKDEGKRPKDLKDGGDPTLRQKIKLYADYEATCARAGVVDFAELLLRAFELWRDNAQLLAHYRQRFRHVLIDEFQDTNAIQYAWIKLLVGSESYPFAVGDDDQSIYRWRGARVENLQQFRRDFPQAKLVRLEQNYRSTGGILAAANALIAHNAGRLGKNLWTSGVQGEPIRIYAAFNERDEADFVMQRIRDWMQHGGQRREVAILYRSNAQSRAFEEAFLSARIPYRVYGGLRFFERAEIKDALAYLRLATNRLDDPSFERVVNLPTRGIGAKTLEVHARVRQRRGLLAVGSFRRLPQRQRKATKNLAPGRSPRCRAS